MPEPNIFDELKVKKQSMDEARSALTGAFPPKADTNAPKDTPPQAVDKVNPKAKFGDKKGETRLPVDQWMKPLGSFKDGTDYVPKTGIYKLHEGEAVKTAEENKMDPFALVPGRSEPKPPKKEIKHIITSRTHDGKLMHKHVHHHPGHPDETHVSNDMSDLHSHFEDHAGTPNEGETPDTGANAPAQLTASPMAQASQAQATAIGE
jgi:hypothetical protein